MSVWLAGLAGLMLLSACQPAAPVQNGTKTTQTTGSITITDNGKTADGGPKSLAANDCSQITPAELAPILEKDSITGNPVTVEQLSPQPVVEGPDEGSWICSYGESLKATFTVYPLPNESAAKAYYDDYLTDQENLAEKLDESQFPNGSYSEIVNTNNNWEGIRSEATGSLMARKGNVTIFIPSMPADKMKQIKIADLFFSKLK